MPSVRRCGWVDKGDDLMVAYHDDEWGVPSHDDRHLFEMLTLEGAQAGLSWSTILRKREGYRRAFAGFDPARSRASTTGRRARCSRPGHRAQPAEGRVDGRTTRARVLDVQEELGASIALPVVVRRRRADREPRRSRAPGRDRPSREAICKDLKRRGFRFVGPTIVLRVHAGRRHGRRPRGRLLPPDAVSGALRARRQRDRSARFTSWIDGPDVVDAVAVVLDLGARAPQFLSGG